MSWRIALLENNIKVTSKVAKELFDLSEKNLSEIWYSEEDVADENDILQFNCDHMEHMDYLWNVDYQKILKKNKIKGRALFGDLDHDTFGEFWGYEFDGRGGMKLLEGKLSWSEKKKGNK